jgi:glycosyltransferase involved in cell wall biosynthesis
VRHEDTGLLVAPGQPAALADSLARLLSDAPLRARLARAARSYVALNYSFERMVGSLERLYMAELARVHSQPVLQSRCAEL